MSGFTQIGVGSSANDGTGDALRTAMQVVNSNYTRTSRALDAVSDLATEAAAAGYSRIVNDSDRGGLFYAVNSGTADNVDIFASATVGWTWQRVRGPWIDIESAGAIGDDSTDNATVIQAVFDRLETLGGGVCYIPYGIFRFGTQLKIPAKCSLIGGGYDSVLKYTATSLGDHPDYYAIVNKHRVHQRYVNALGETTQASGFYTASGQSISTDSGIVLENFRLTGTALTNADYTSSTFTFAGGGTTVTDSAAQFLAQGFAADQKLYVVTTSPNVGAYNIASVTAGTITISGDTFSADSGSSRRLVGFKHRGGIFLGRVQDCRIINVWIEDAVNFGWNVYLWGVRNQVIGGNISCQGEVTEDGIHIYGSDNIVNGTKINCGDDIVPIGSCQYEAAERNFIANVNGETQYGYLKLIADYKAIDGVFISNCRFSCGQVRNGCFETELNNGAAVTDIKNVKMRGVVFIQDAAGTHSGNNVRAFTLHAGVNIDLDVEIQNALTGPSSPAVDILNASKVTLKLRLLGTQTYRQFGIKVKDSNDIRFNDGRFENAAVTLDNCDRVEFEGNAMPDIASGSSAFSITDCTDVIINDNNTIGSSGFNYGVTCGGTVTNLTVSGNNFNGCDQAVNVTGNLAGTSYIQGNSPKIQSATVSSGSLNANGSDVLEVTGEGGLADTLSQINRAQTGQFLMLKKAAASGNITVASGGNIAVGGSRLIDDTSKYVLLYFDGTNCQEIVNGT